MRACLPVAAALLLLAGPGLGIPAHARTRGADGAVFRFPSAQIPDIATLRPLLQRSDVPTTIVFEKGEYRFSSAAPFFVFGRSNLTLCGATGRSGDVVISDTGTAGGVVLLEQTRNITLRDLTVRVAGATPGVSAISCRSVLSTELRGFVRDTRIERCTLEGNNGIIALSGTEDMTISRTKFIVTNEDGFGIRWDDGPGLLVSRSRFVTAPDVAGFSGIFVRGAQSAFAEGARARRVVLTRNRIEGDFQRGIDLADVVETRVRGNRIVFRDPVREATPLNGSVPVGRVGVLVRRGAAAALPEDYEIHRNKVRKAAYGVWLLNVGEGKVTRNDLRRCGMTDAEAAQEMFFVPEGERGGAVRLVLQTQCRITVERNDFRNLRSPLTFFLEADEKDAPAVFILPESFGPDCFPGGNVRNRLSRGRMLVLVDTDDDEDDPE